MAETTKIQWVRCIPRIMPDGRIRMVKAPAGWLGVSVEDQAAADERIPHLLRTPAAVRFLSVEPMLGPIDLRPWLRICPQCGKLDAPNDDGWTVCCDAPVRSGIHWIIVGGESGQHARPCHVEWVRSIVEQCQAAGVPVFCKQLGAQPVVSERYSDSDGAIVRMAGIRDSKGGDMSEFPLDLRVRQFPAAAVEEQG